jgi:hypothetical protein
MVRGSFLIAAAALAALAGPLAVAVAAAAPSGPAPVLWVLTAPWADAERVLHEAGAREIGPERPALGRLVAGEGDDLARRLASAGALLAIGDPRLLALCGVGR